MWPFVPIEIDGSLSPVVLATTFGIGLVNGTVSSVFENAGGGGTAARRKQCRREQRKRRRERQIV